MDISINKADFESILEDFEETLELLDHCVDDNLMKILKDVLSEYNTHYKGDIEALMTSHDALEDQVEQLKDDVLALNSDIDGLDSELEELSGEVKSAYLVAEQWNKAQFN